MTGADAQAAARECQIFNNLHGRQHLVVAEKRGIYSFTVLTSRDALSSCLLSHPANGVSTGAGGTGDNPNGLVQPSGDQVVTLNQSSQWEHDRGSYISVIGRSGPDVVGVDVTLRDGTDVKATLKGSWWTMWAPGSRYPTTITVHDTDGTSRTQKFG